MEEPKIKLSDDSITHTDFDAFADWIRTYPKLSRGELIVRFENTIASKVGARYCIFVNSGSSANLLIIAALKESGRLKNDKIVVPAVSWATTLSPVMHLGLTPILCDCNLSDLSVDLDELENIFLKSQPAALILVSVLGMVPDYDRIIRLCEKYDVIMIEDACESLGSSNGNYTCGSVGLAGSYSFYFSHQLCTIEGGAVVTSDHGLYDVMIMITEHGWARRAFNGLVGQMQEQWEVDDFQLNYTFFYPGFNLRGMEIQGFLGLRQMTLFDEIRRARDLVFRSYQELIHNAIWKPVQAKDFIVSNMGYPIIHPKKKEIVVSLNKAGIEHRPLISGNMGLQPFYVKKYGERHLENADTVHNSGLYIPNHPRLSDSDILFVSDTLNRVIAES